MPKFEDTKGREWSIELDGILLDAMRQETGVDLADLSAGGLATIEQDAISLVKVLAVLCRDEMKEANLRIHQFSKAITGDVLTAAFEAILRAAENFFPPKTWSDVRSRLTNQQSFNQQWASLRPIFAKLNEPEVPKSLSDGIMTVLSQMMGNVDLEDLKDKACAGGQDTTLPPPATDLPENAELTPAD